MMPQRPVVHALILGIFCLVFGVILATTDLFTHDTIKLRAVEDLQNSLTLVIPASIHDNNPVSDAVVIKDGGRDVTVYRAMKGGTVTGAAYAIEGSGYGGPITLMLGVDPEGKILGVRATAFHETPGLGDRIDAAKSDWITRFTGLWLGHPPADKWKVKKDGGVFDQFAGATITPRGVVAAVKNGLEFFARHKADILEGRR